MQLAAVVVTNSGGNMGDDTPMAVPDVPPLVRLLATRAEAAAHNMRVVEAWIWRNVVATDVWPQELPADLQSSVESLTGALEEVQRTASDLYERAVEGPLRKLLAGAPLTAQEYYLLRAHDFVPMHFTCHAGLNEYGMFSLMHYEDERRQGVINPALGPDRGVGMKFGLAPEQVSRAALSEAQRSFLQENFPEAYERLGP